MINKVYLDPKTLEKIRPEFKPEKEFPSVVLFQFLETTEYAKIRKEILGLDYAQQWVLLSHSYSCAELSPGLKIFFKGNEFLNFLSQIVHRHVKSMELQAYAFGRKDYTILTDQIVEEPGIDIIFDVTGEWDERAKGLIIYKDSKENFISLPIQGNMLAIVERKKGVSRYVQYVNHYAQTKKRQVVMGRMRSSPQKSL